MNFDTFRKLTEELEKLITDLSGQEHTWLSPLIDYILLGILSLCFIWALLVLLSKIRTVWIEVYWPLFYKKEQERRRDRRKIFAQHIEHQLIQLNIREEWKDYRFTELEAEIEAEGKWKKQTIIPFLQTNQRGLRREKSLSKALECSSERLILVEGEPGSGKSVALRHLTEKLAKQASKSNNIKSVIPLYINLKKLERDSQNIDRNLIEDFVKKELNRINDRDIEEFLDNEFYRGVKEGTWLFLFDSFDELPEVLSSVESDQVIRNYAEAIDAFLGGFNKCRGIIASRQFRGPKHLGWPRFRILPLENRRLELISKADLDPPIEKELIKHWRNASHDIQQMTKNPMFLSILCENMRDGIPFPENTHSVFEIYLNKRLTRDQERLKKRFNLEPTEIKAIAEQVAFCMTLDQNLGLSPTRNAIREGMRNAEFRVPGNFDKLLDALEYLKLTRSEEESIEEDKKFTFSHRRFQEYFATCVVLRDLERISPQKLLKDGRWRETTVVIFQTQPSETFTPILTEANKMLTEMVGSVSGLIDDPRGYISDELQQEKYLLPQPFYWPDGVIHLLGLLQDGFKSRLEDLGDNIQDQAERLLLSATVKGTLQDRKWGLEVAGITSQPVLVWLLRDAFSGESQWLKEVAYQQTARLEKIPDDIAASIRKNLLRLFATGRLYKEYFTTEAHLSRLDNSKQYLNSLRLLRWIRPIDLILHFFVLIFLLYLNYTFPYFITFTILGFIFLVVSYFSLHPYSLEISSAKVYHNKLVGRLLGSMSFIISPYARFFLFPLLWSIFAILAVNTGQFTELWWWIFLLLFPLFYFICNLRKFLKFCKSILGNVWIYIILLFYTLLLYLIWWTTENTENILAKILIGIYIIFMIFSMLFFLRYLYQSLNEWFLDWNQLRKWVKQNKYPNTIDIQELLRLINSYRTEDFSKQLITISRERELIIVNKNTENILNELATIIENSLFLRNKQRNRNREVNKKIRRKKQILFKKLFKNILNKPSNIIKLLVITFTGYKRSKYSLRESMIENYSESDFFTNLLKQYTRKDKERLVNLGSEFLDELYILIEQIRVRQKTTENPNN